MIKFQQYDKEISLKIVGVSFPANTSKKTMSLSSFLCHNTFDSNFSNETAFSKELELSCEKWFWWVGNDFRAIPLFPSVRPFKHEKTILISWRHLHFEVTLSPFQESVSTSFWAGSIRRDQVATC